MTKAALQLSKKFSINQVGAIPLREIARFVKVANLFAANVAVRCGGSHANGKNLFEIAELPLRGRQDVTLSVFGADAQECMEGLGKVVGGWASQRELEVCL